MFTGLIEELGTVVDLTYQGTSQCLKIEALRVFRRDSAEEQFSANPGKNTQNGLKIGDSIAVNGICLTVTSVEPSTIGNTMPYFEVTAVEETLRRTTLGSLTVGKKINLERAATLETRLGGHLVQGHVDGVATVRSIRERDPDDRSSGGSWEFDFEIPSTFVKYAIPKGSITIDGVSLTIADIVQADGNAPTVRIAIIPHTYHHTNFQFLKKGNAVNVEFDIIAKMVEQLVKPYQ